MEDTDRTTQTTLLEARIDERGNGFCDVGAYITDGDDLYQVVDLSSTIHTEAPGVANYITGHVRRADWDDITNEQSDDIVCSCAILGAGDDEYDDDEYEEDDDPDEIQYEYSIHEHNPAVSSGSQIGSGFVYASDDDEAERLIRDEVETFALGLQEPVDRLYILIDLPDCTIRQIESN